MNTISRLSFIAVMLFSMTFSQALAQENTASTKPQEVVVRIQQEPPKTPDSIAQKTNEWVDVGTNLGTAFGAAAKSILHETKDATFGKDVSLVDGIDKFSKTEAGRFTMLMVGWKIMGKDAVELVDKVKSIAFSIPLVLGWTVLFIWFYRRNFLPHRIVVSKQGPFWNRKVEYNLVNERLSGDAGGLALVSSLIYVLVLLTILFNTIL